jgi:hypothetical protein
LERYHPNGIPIRRRIKVTTVANLRERKKGVQSMLLLPKRFYGQIKFTPSPGNPKGAGGIDIVKIIPSLHLLGVENRFKIEPIEFFGLGIIEIEGRASQFAIEIQLLHPVEMPLFFGVDEFKMVKFRTLFFYLPFFQFILPVGKSSYYIYLSIPLEDFKMESGTPHLGKEMGRWWRNRAPKGDSQ